MAVNCHSIPRAACVEALAPHGHLYTRRQSFNALMRMGSQFDFPDFERISVNRAGTFKGYCATHDARLFAPAEMPDSTAKNNMFAALQLRSFSVEYCRKRFALDFCTKLFELNPEYRSMPFLNEWINNSAFFATSFRKVYLNSMFARVTGTMVDKVDYLLVPIARNLEVSCCGCFNQTDSFDSVIAYNLISYSNISLLVLTTFQTVNNHLDNFLGMYNKLDKLEAMINDIAFLHCEEPLISENLWNSLNENAKNDIKASLCHPDFRLGSFRPDLIKINNDDLYRDITPELRNKIPHFLFAESDNHG